MTISLEFLRCKTEEKKKTGRLPRVKRVQYVFNLRILAPGIFSLIFFGSVSLQLCSKQSILLRSATSAFSGSRKSSWNSFASCKINLTSTSHIFFSARYISLRKVENYTGNWMLFAAISLRSFSLLSMVYADAIALNQSNNKQVNWESWLNVIIIFSSDENRLCCRSKANVIKRRNRNYTSDLICADLLREIQFHGITSLLSRAFENLSPAKLHNTII